MKSKSKTKQQSTETVAPSTYSQPYINDAAAQLKPGFDQAQANVQTLMPKLNAGLDYYGDVLGGKYLNSNPHLGAIINDTNRSVADGVNSEFSLAGRYGSGAHTGVLTDRLAANESKLRYGDYAQERAYMDSAPRNLAGMVTTSATLPQLPASQYADAINALMGRYVTGNSSGTSTTTQKQGMGSLIGGIAGAGLSGWASGGFKGF